MSKRPLKGQAGEQKTFHMNMDAELHAKLVDLAYRKNTSLKALVTNLIIDFIRHS